jgi:hypothetical protein
VAVRSWKGNAVQVKQIATIAVANTWAQNDTATITVDGLDFVVTIGTLVTTAQVATTIKQAFNGETLTDTAASCTIAVADGGAQAIPALSEMVATVSSSTVTLTARTAGKPFTISVSETTAGTGTATLTLSATANAGKHEWDNADNWSAATVPVDDDVLAFNEGNVDLKWDLSTAIQLATINKSMVYTGNVGLAETDTDNAAKPYRQYRTPTYLTTDDNTVTTTANLETGQGRGSSRFKWDAGAGQVVLHLYGKPQRAETGVPATLFKGSHASNEINNNGGDLGIAFFPGETAVVATLRNGDGPASQAETTCGTGVTLTTVVSNGGKVHTASAMTTASEYGGEWDHRVGTITTLNVLGGTFYPLADATITTLTVGSGGVFDARKGADAFVITNTIQLYAGASFYDPQGRAGNVVFKLNNCSPADVTIVLPPNKTYTLST